MKMDKKIVEKVGDILAFPFVIIMYVIVQIIKFLFFSIVKMIERESKQNGKKVK